MSAAARLAQEWWDDEYGADAPTGTEHDKEDMLNAFIDGFDAAWKAGWFGADGPYAPGKEPTR